MKLLRFKSVRTRLTFWFLALSLSPLLVALIISYFQRVQTIETSTYDKLIAIRNLKVQELTKWVNERVGDLHVMSGDYEIRNLENIFDKKLKTAIDEQKIITARELFKRNLKHYTVYSEIFYIEAKNGIVQISTNSEYIGSNKSNNSYFTEPLKSGDIFIKNIYNSQDTGENEMTFSIPVYCMAHNTHIIGILVCRINLENSLYPLIGNTIGLGSTGETLIVNKDGVALNELRWHDNAPLKLQITAEPAVRAAKGETGIIASTDYREEDVLAAYTFVPSLGWGFVCKQDMRELKAPIRKIILNFTILFILSGIVISFIALTISKSISKPILAMDQVAQKIKMGDNSARNIITSEDELGILATEFNRMADVTESKIKIQLGISDISKTMIGKTNMHEFCSSLLKRLMKISKANMSVFYILNDETEKYESFVSIGANKEMLSSYNAKNTEGELGNAISTRKIFHLKDITENTVFKYKTVAGDIIPREIITIPIVVEDVIAAIISLVHIQSFESDHIEILKQSWPSINTSYSNLIAGERTRILAEHLSGINQQLEAQSKELQQQTEELQNQTEELSQTTETLENQNVELENQRKKVESANKLKSEFLANMSHELRTPLNSIMALSSVLIMRAKDKLDDEENDYLKIVERNGKRLLDLINDILDLSKIEAGKMDVEPKLTAIDGLAQTLIENISALSEQKGLTLSLNTQKKLPKVNTDESRLHQALLNIVANAVKFTEKGMVEIAINYDKTNVYIDVRDTGIGITKDVLPHIFDEFRQADGTSSKQYEGTGLGLSIAKKIITILGGKIRVKSEFGVGSIFTITIPIKWHNTIASNLSHPSPK